jgi:Fe-S cluster assembly iron-binding protein IscA
VGHDNGGTIGTAQVINALRNTEIDLVDKGLGQKQLVFNNPNIKHSCGCGESFSVEE